jgi:AcrR family transcriptional regulator
MPAPSSQKSNRSAKKAVDKPAGKPEKKFKYQASSMTKATLLDAAQRHFSSRGFGASSVHQIAGDAGVNVSLINYHFGGKEGLFKACLERAGVDRLLATERLLEAEPTSFIEVKCRITMFVDAVLCDGIANPEIFNIMLQGLECDFPMIEELYQRTFHRIFEILVKFLEAARTKKFLAAWMVPELSAQQLMGAIVHALRTDGIRKRIYKKSISEPENREICRDHLVKVFLEGQLFVS